MKREERFNNSNEIPASSKSNNNKNTVSDSEKSFDESFSENDDPDFISKKDFEAKANFFYLLLLRELYQE